MSVDDQRQEVHRILSSVQFRRAPKLRRFLELICDYHVHGRCAEITEFVVATKAFGKGADFEPSEDSLVRVQAREVRRRLREYYQNDGKDSALILDLPVGGYAPVFSPRPQPAVPSALPLPVAAGPHTAIRAAWCILGGTVLTCAILLFAADRERRLLIRTASAATAERPAPGILSPPVAGLWKRFLDSDAPTVLVVSNPVVGECADQKPGTQACPDEFTGMGEAVGIHLITNLFRPSKQTLMVKESRIVNADDIKRYNLILLGGKGVNVWTRRLGEDLSLFEPGQPRTFDTTFDTRTGQITRDRAIVALRKSPASGRWVLFLWGRHSQGTGGAVEASTDERFLSRLTWPAPASPFPDSFHVLLSVAVNDGLPEEPVPVAVRVP